MLKTQRRVVEYGARQAPFLIAGRSSFLVIGGLVIALGWLLATGGGIDRVRLARADTVVGNGTPQSCTESTLSQAISAGGLITFNCGANPVTFTLHTAQPVSKATTIDGGNLITLDGNNQSRLLSISGGVTLTVKNLTLSNAYATSDGAAISGSYQANLVVSGVRFIHNVCNPPANGDSGGGAIYVHSGTLLVDNSQFTNNASFHSSGGAIHALLSNVTVTNSLFDSNTSSGPGYAGAFYNDGTLGPNGYIIIRRSTFNNNQGQGQGGAVFSFLYTSSGSPAQPGSYGLINNTSFTGNSVTTDSKGDALGGALRLGNGRFTVTNSLFSSNTAQSQGGAIWTGEVSDIDLANLTLTGNSAVSSDGKNGLGGGLAIVSSGPLRLTNDTIANNLAGFMGGGTFGGGSNVILTNSIVANNHANNGGNPWNINHNCATTLASGGPNLQTPAKSGDSNDHDCTAGITIADPQLASLADNGGLTKTRAILPTSPARDQGGNTACASSPVNGQDARGVPRPVGTACDIGAFEFVPPPSIAATFSPSVVPAGSPATLSFTLTNPSPATLTGAGFSATLSAGLTLTSASPLNNCQGTGTLVAAAGTGAISLSQAQLGPNQTCTIQVQVSSSTPGTYYLSGGSLSALQTGPGSNVNPASLKVAAPLLGAVPGAPGATLRMGALALNSSRSLTLTIANQGDPVTTLQIQNLGLSGGDTSFSLNAPASFSLSGGSSRVVTVTCTPATTGQHTITLSFTSNDTRYSTVSYTLICVGAGYVVTNPADDGQGDLPGSLSYIIKNNAGANPIGIIFDTSASGLNGTVISLSGSVTIPAQVTVDGGCSNGPGIVLQPATSGFNGAAGVQVSGGATLRGLKVTHFPAAQIHSAGGGNYFSCIEVIR